MKKVEVMEQIRSFIAIELNEEVKQKLRQIQGILKIPGSDCVKWVEPENIHLTLKFLGNVLAANIQYIIEVLRAVAEEVTPFTLEINNPGAFPNLTRVQTIWVGVAGDIKTLHHLQSKLENSLKKLGYPPENRNFTPHLTLGRVRDEATLLFRQNLGKVISGTIIESKLTIQVETLSLMRSQLTRSGPIYSRLSSVELKGSCQA